MQYNCPVCNKAGLPDYMTSPTICPQCNSDLKPFMLLKTISKQKSSNLNLYVISGALIIAIILAFFYFNSITANKRRSTENSKIVLQLQDSIRNLKTNIESNPIEQLVNNKTKKEISIQYKVKKGDNLTKVAKFFYNDFRLYKKIETDNNLQQPYTLKIGQPLTIKLKQ